MASPIVDFPQFPGCQGAKSVRRLEEQKAFGLLAEKVGDVGLGTVKCEFDVENS